MKKVFLIFLYLCALNALSQEGNILELIRSTGIDKYSNIKYKSKMKHPELDDVKNYFFQAILTSTRIFLQYLKFKIFSSLNISDNGSKPFSGPQGLHHCLLS